MTAGVTSAGGRATASATPSGTSRHAPPITVQVVAWSGSIRRTTRLAPTVYTAHRTAAPRVRTSPTSDEPSDSACEPPITTATPANAMSAPGELGRREPVHAHGRREERDEDRRRGDQQRGVARADLRQPRRPQDLVAAEPDQPEPDQGREAGGWPDRALPSPQDEQQRDRGDEVPRAREGERPERADRRLDDDEVRRPDQDGDEEPDLGEAPGRAPTAASPRVPPDTETPAGSAGVASIDGPADGPSVGGGVSLRCLPARARGPPRRPPR